jgi:hypothetical protein
MCDSLKYLANSHRYHSAPRQGVEEPAVVRERTTAGNMARVTMRVACGWPIGRDRACYTGLGAGVADHVRHSPADRASIQTMNRPTPMSE